MSDRDPDREKCKQDARVEAARIVNDTPDEQLPDLLLKASRFSGLIWDGLQDCDEQTPPDESLSLLYKATLYDEIEALCEEKLKGDTP